MRYNLLLKLSLLATAILYIQTAWATSINVSGNVSGTWSADTVKVIGDLVVPAGEALIIEHGVRVEFQGPYQVVVKGHVIAIGTESSLIRFVISDTTGFSDTLSASGGWHGFFYEHLMSSEDSSVYKYCRFEHGKAFSADTMGMYGGAFRILDFGKISFMNCSFAHNFAIRSGGAIYARNANIRVERCEFFQNKCGLLVFPYGYGGAFCSVRSSPIVLNNYFIANNSTGVGGGASFEYSNPELLFNVFRENYSALGGGFGFLRSEAGRVVSNNLVQGNEAKFFGGGICCIRDYTVFSNITITGNLASMGGGFYCNDSAAPSLYNSIIYENIGFGNEVYIWDFLSAPNFYYCDIKGGPNAFEGSGGQQGYHGIYQNNLDTAVLFSISGQYPWGLEAGSPCRDAGTPDTTGLQVPLTDLAGNQRIINARIDIGAYEFGHGEWIAENYRDGAEIKVFPNPSQDMVHIKILNTVKELTGCSIFSVDGRLVRSISQSTVMGGSVELTWDLMNDQGVRVNPGLYIIRSAGDNTVRGSGIIIINPPR
jgi:predicted outer membrane repeat protein